METQPVHGSSFENPSPEASRFNQPSVLVPKKPELTEEQREHVLKETARRLVEAVIGGSGTSLEESLGEAGHVTVWGAFVSVKGPQGLRACCGQIGGAQPLGRALEAATQRSAQWDLRFPPLQPRELSHLTVEIWLLWKFQTVNASGEARVNAVEVGRHGVQVARGNHRGLLLPGVAVEHHLDARAFLEHVCRKAGLPPNAWLDSATELAIFEGYALAGELRSLFPGDLSQFASLPISMGDVVRLAAFAHHNLLALFQGATPNYYTSTAYDGPVQGIILTIKQKTESGEIPHRVLEASRVFPRGELPLQATLMDLLRTAVTGIRGQRIDPQVVPSLQTGLTIFVEPHLIGTAIDCALDGVDPRFHAVCVVQDDRWAVRYDSERTASELLDSVLRRLKTARPSYTQVYRLTTLSTERSVEASNVSRPVAGQSVRPPAVAGQFYPADLSSLNEALDSLLPQNVARENWAAALVPHAGWRYSGQLAAEVWTRLRVPSRVIIFGPKHHAVGCDWAVTPHRTWALPGLSLQADPDFARSLVEAVPLFELDAAAHAMEHAIEVQLPMVARLASASRVLGVVMHGGDYDVIQKAAKELAGFLATLEELPLLAISSDLNHYADDETTRRVDRLVLEALDSCDPLRLWKTVREQRISMCGIIPAVFVLETLRQLGRLQQCTLVGYTTSAETSGRKDRVVGYAGALFK